MFLYLLIELEAFIVILLASKQEETHKLKLEEETYSECYADDYYAIKIYADKYTEIFGEIWMEQLEELRFEDNKSRKLEEYRSAEEIYRVGRQRRCSPSTWLLVDFLGLYKS